MTPFDFDPSRFYCLHCLLVPDNQYGRFATEWGMKKHLEQHHDFPVNSGDEGKDYVRGWQARQIAVRRLAAAEEASKRAHEYFEQPDYTLADFLTDCGAS